MPVQWVLGYTYGVVKIFRVMNRNSHAANFEWNQSLVANSPNLSLILI
jgi:hypothetical protein